MSTVGVVAEVRRYPVKSLAGETLDAVAADHRGLAGDRRFAVVDGDGKLGSAKTTRRFTKLPGLLDLTATYDADGVPVVGFTDGRRLRGDDPAVDAALSDVVGRPVRLREEQAVSHFDEGPLHLVTTASMTALADLHGVPVTGARLRASIVIDTGHLEGFVEDGWTGSAFAIGDGVVVSIREPMSRCVLLDLPQHGTAAAPGLLAALGRANDACIGLVADVVQPGIVRRGDTIRFV